MEKLEAFGSDIGSGKYGNIDGILVIRHGRIVFERSYFHDYAVIYSQEAKTRGPLNNRDFDGPFNYFNPAWYPFYQGSGLHTLQSVTKTVTSLVIGIAISRGDFPSLDTPVLNFFGGALQ